MPNFSNFRGFSGIETFKRFWILTLTLFLGHFARFPLCLQFRSAYGIQYFKSDSSDPTSIRSRRYAVFARLDCSCFSQETSTSELSGFVADHWNLRQVWMLRVRPTAWKDAKNAPLVQFQRGARVTGFASFKPTNLSCHFLVNLVVSDNMETLYRVQFE